MTRAAEVKRVGTGVIRLLHQMDKVKLTPQEIESLGHMVYQEFRDSNPEDSLEPLGMIVVGLASGTNVCYRCGATEKRCKCGKNKQIMIGGT